jgi:formate dehydrogenase maturation protein FdhE
MAKSAWQRRMERAKELRDQYSFAAEILDFFVQIAGFQEDLHRELNHKLKARSDSTFSALSLESAVELSSEFDFFLFVVEKYGPATLVEVSRKLQARGKPSWTELLINAWLQPAPSDAETILTQAFLQPCAELLRSRMKIRPAQQTYAACPCCNRRPNFGVLRPMGEGASRSMACGFCLAEWDFRRIVCPGCGEENDAKLAVFTASDWHYIRVECCDTCKTYLKTIDLTKDGHAEPVVDELASAPLDLWAREHGYAKLHSNMLGM